MKARSPWERVLGERVSELEPSLQRYFGRIPTGSIGQGHGVFERVGTPRRWLWPVLSVLGVDGVIFPAWEQGLAFSIENRPTAHGTIRAVRTFHFRSGDRAMIDEIGVGRHGLLDRMGRHGVVAVHMHAEVVDGCLRLFSTNVGIRVGSFFIPLGPLSPKVSLIERAAGESQHVTLTLDAPILGRIYEYEGSFRYTVSCEEHNVG